MLSVIACLRAVCCALSDACWLLSVVIRCLLFAVVCLLLVD